MDDVGADRVKSLFDKIGVELVPIWDRIGYSSSKKNEYLEQLCGSIETVIGRRVVHFLNRECHYQRKLKHTMTSIEKIVRLLKCENQYQLDHSTEENATLIESCNAATQYLDSLTMIKKRRIESFNSVVARCLEIEELVGMSLGTRCCVKRFLDVDLPSEFRSEDLWSIGEGMYLDLSDGIFGELEAQLEGLRLNLKDRERRYDELNGEIVKYSRYLCEDGSYYLIESVLMGCKLLSDEGLQLLEEVALDLQKTSMDRENAIREYAIEIRGLWDFLSVPNDYRSQFISSNDGLSLLVIENCKSELRRMEGLKIQQMNQIIARHWERINELWRELNALQSERDGLVKHFESESVDELDLLARMKGFIAALEHKLEMASQIARQIQEREALLKKKDQLNVLANDPKRLLSKKPESNNLKFENGLRRDVARLPRATERLVAKLMLWEREMGSPFMYEGKDYLRDVLEEEERVLNEERLRRAEERKNRLYCYATPVKANSSKGPLNGSIASKGVIKKRSQCEDAKTMAASR